MLAARRLLGVVGVVALLFAGGCRSAFVNATVRNQTNARVRLLEVDYPSASFGRESLAAGGVFTYRFKIMGNGPVKVTWTDFQRRQFTVVGPELREGQQGDLTITLTPRGGAEWDARLTPEH